VYLQTAFATLMRANMQLGRHRAAAEAVEGAQRVDPEGGIEVWQANLLATTGRADEARSILARRRTGRIVRVDRSVKPRSLSRLVNRRGSCGAR
jgi:hypothetical protein